MWRICRMDRGASAGALPHLVRGARVVTIGQQNFADAKAGNPFEISGRRFHWIDAEISARLENEVTVEVVAVRVRKPWPRTNAAQRVTHSLPQWKTTSKKEEAEFAPRRR